MNTKLTYLYRDGSNYKQWDDVVLAGAVDPEMIRRHLWEGNFFIPQAGAESDRIGEKLDAKSDELMVEFDKHHAELVEAHPEHEGKLKAALMTWFGGGENT